jgi:hypothetical protein
MVTIMILDTELLGFQDLRLNDVNTKHVYPGPMHGVTCNQS